MRRKSDIDKIDGNDALIKSAVILGFAVFVDIRSKERPTTHASVAMPFSVFIYFVGKHNLFGYIIGNHSLSGTLCGKLGKIPILSAFPNIVFLKYVYKFRKRRRYPNALFVLYALIALQKRFFYYHRKVFAFSVIFRFSEIHKHRYERSLSVSGKKRNDLVLYGLHASLYFCTKTFFYNLCLIFVTDFYTEFGVFGVHILLDFFSANLHERS